MASIANLLVSLKTDFAQSDTTLGQLISKLTRVGEEAHKAGEEVKGAGSKIDSIKGGAEHGGEGLDTLKDAFSDLSGEIVAFGAEALALTTIFEALKEAVEVSAELESTQVALESLTGSAESATEVLENMEKVAKSEALSFSDLVPAAQHMIALGFSVEETTEAMKAAGNAAWALGEPVQSVSQRIGMIAQSGRVSALFLRTLGLSTEDLGKVMGISAGEVSKAFQALSETDRLEVLIAALGKFGDVASKEADTQKGKWTELKNVWHENFHLMGDDLEYLTKGLEDLAIAASKHVQSVLQDIKKLGTGIAVSLITGSSKYTADVLKYMDMAEEEAKKQKAKEAEKKSSGSPEDLKKRVGEGLAPLRAKEYAPVKLEEIKGAEEANARLAQLNRERTNSEIAAEHERRQAIIDENEDATARARETAEEEIRVAKEKQQRIGAIDAEEARVKANLLKARVAPEVAETYSPKGDEADRAAKIAAIDQKLKNELAKNADDLRLKQEKSADAVAAAVSKSIIVESKITLGQTKTDRDIAGAKIKADADVKSIQYQEQKIKLEGDYENQLAHTFAEQIAHLDEVAALERKGRDAKIEGLQSELKNIPSTDQSDAAQKKRADIANQIAKAEAESSVASAEATNKRLKAEQDYLKVLREVSDIQLKSDASVKSEKIGEQKTKAEAEYAAQLSHTDEQEIAHLTTVSQLESAQRQVEIQSKQDQLALLPKGVEYAKERAALESEIADSQAQANSATLQSAIQIAQKMEEQNHLLTAQKELAQALVNWRQIDFGDVAKSFADSLVKVPQGIGQAIAGGLFDHEKGKSMGQVMAKEIVSSLKEGAKNLAGNLATQGIEKLISAIVGQSVFASAQVTALAANTTALAVLTAAVTASTAATVGETGVEAASGAVSGIGGFGGILKGLLGIFGLAEGGSTDSGTPYLVGEKGPELFIPKNSGDIIPHGQSMSILHTIAQSNKANPGDLRGSVTTNIHLHGASFYGVTNTREMMRQIANLSKLSSSKFSPST